MIPGSQGEQSSQAGKHQIEGTAWFLPLKEENKAAGKAPYVQFLLRPTRVPTLLTLELLYPLGLEVVSETFLERKQSGDK